MYLPHSTYRLQINATFPFSKVKEIIPYLKKLGISTVYAAPFFAAKPESSHGYDGVNPEIINPEIGTLEEFKEIAALLKENKMGWLQDIVPNHMSFDPHNAWLMDVFEKGPHSDYASFFDINWQDSLGRERVVTPFLGEEPESLILKGDLRIAYNQKGFYLEYYSIQYPLNWKSYYDILKSIKVPEVFCEECQNLLDDFLLVKNNFDDADIVSSTSRLKEVLFGFYVSHTKLKECLDQHLQQINKNVETFTSILDQQFFELVPYSKSDTAINYRRFFVINDLICLKMEDKPVFDRFHSFIKTLVDQKWIQGVRIDHIDGLKDPKKYVERLRETLGEDTYVIVEKILATEERMPDNWPIQGTSGYEFLATMNHVFTKTQNKDRIMQIYREFTGLTDDYNDMVREKKIYMLKKRMGGELDHLLTLLLQTEEVKQKELSASRLKEALFELLVSFPVYRTYVDAELCSSTDEEILKKAVGKARAKTEDLEAEWQVIDAIFSKNGLQEEGNRRFLMRLQQFTGPLAAKGVEDTVFYVYNRLVSHNEVGDCPRSFGVTTERFHELMKERQTFLPDSLNTLSTHDTKRGEDARARLNVITEMPEEWARVVFEWKKNNQKYKTQGKCEMPDANDEYFLYQSILGGFPMEGEIEEKFVNRLKDFMLKALREAKIYTDYPTYNNEYEEATMKFIEAILGDDVFMDSFLPFFQKVSDLGIGISLGQTLLKMTVPGIPDTYQGSELWELSFVDPDNRRTINFEEREKIVDELVQQKDIEALLKDLVTHKRNGKIKLFVTRAALNERLLYPEVFHKGDYIPVEFTGERSQQLVGFVRRFLGQWMMVIVPRETIGITNASGKEEWGDSHLLLPDGAPLRWVNVFTTKKHDASHYSLHVGEVLSNFPVALLKNI